MHGDPIEGQLSVKQLNQWLDLQHSKPRSKFAKEIRKQEMLRRRMRVNCSSNSFRGTLQTHACTWKVYLPKPIKKSLPNTTASI